MRNWSAIFLSLFLAIILMLMPMPDWAIWYRPAWVLLVLIYWAMTSPNQVNVGVAWFIGLIVDLLNGTLLGEHALGYTVVIYMVSRVYLRLRMAPVIQQGFSVLFFVLIYQFILYCIQGFIGELPTRSLYWMSSVTSMLLWPWLYLVLQDFHRGQKVT